MSKITTKASDNTPKFTKECICNANKYAGQRDIVHALLNDNEMYSLEEVDAIIKDFLTKEVK